MYRKKYIPTTHYKQMQDLYSVQKQESNPFNMQLFYINFNQFLLQKIKPISASYL